MLDSLHKKSRSWGVKIILAMIVVVFVFWGVSGLDNGSRNVLATVDGKPISAPDFMRRYQQEAEQLRAANPGVTTEMLDRMNFRQQVLHSMVVDMLIDEELKRLELGVSPAELKKAIVSMPQFMDDNGVFSPERYTQRLAAQGYTPGTFETLLQRDLLRAKLNRILSAAVSVSDGEARDYFNYAAEKRSMDYILFPEDSYLDKIQLDDEALAKWYDEHKETFKKPREIDIEYVLITPATLREQYQPTEEQLKEFYERNLRTLFRSEELVHARHILILTPKGSNPEAMKAAEEKIRDIAAKLKNGGDFAKLAAEYSQDPGSATNGGDLGWFGRNRMVKQFEDVAFSLKPGDVSDVFQTVYGFHIMKVEEHQPERIRPFEEVRMEAANRYAEDEATRALQSVLDGVLDDVLSGKSLEESAKAHKLNVRTDNALTRENAGARLSLRKEDVDALFLAPAGVTLDRPFAIPAGYMLSVVKTERPEYIEPFERVRDSVLASVRREGAAKLAREAAEGLVAEIKENKDMPVSDMKTTSLFGRNGLISELGPLPEVAQAVFAAEKGIWIERVFDTPAGALVVRLREVKEPSDAEWTPVADMVKQSVTQSKQEQAYRNLVQALWEQTKVEVRMPELLKSRSEAVSQ